MKHEKEWHTCDRCGVEIKYGSRSIITRKICCLDGFTVGVDTFERFKNFELCPKCAKEFKRFMKNEHDRIDGINNR